MSESDDPFTIFLNTNLSNPDFNNWVLYTLHARAKYIIDNDANDRGMSRERLILVFQSLDFMIQEITQNVPDMSKLGDYLKGNMTKKEFDDEYGNKP